VIILFVATRPGSSNDFTEKIFEITVKTSNCNGENISGLSFSWITTCPTCSSGMGGEE